MPRPHPRSAAAEAYRAWYRTARWRKLRQQQLRQEPLCRMCREAGRVTAATVCDHVEPHRGDEAKFWGGPFQSLCAAHHDGRKQREERRGYRVGSGVDGRPVDLGHSWNTRQPKARVGGRSKVARE